jgi:hypothetical protein
MMTGKLYTASRARQVYACWSNRALSGAILLILGTASAWPGRSRKWRGAAVRCS